MSEAASREAEIRPPPEEVEGDESVTTAEAVAETRPEELPPKQKISNDMKDRLRKELTAQGADPNKSAGNPILVVAAVIAVLVVVGGQGQTSRGTILRCCCVLLCWCYCSYIIFILILYCRCAILCWHIHASRL